MTTSGEATSGEATSDEATSGEAGDGDAEPDPEPEPVCDVSQFEALSPMWLMQAPPVGIYTYQAMVPLDDGLVALAFDAKGQEPPRLQRVNDVGELVWEVEVEVDSGARLGWGGDDFIYVVSNGRVVRHSLADGQLLPWLAVFNPYLQAFAIEADGPELMIGGGVEHGEDGHQQYDAWIAGFDASGTHLLQDEFGVEHGREIVQAIEALSSGGYVAVIGDAGLEFRGYGGADLSFNLIGFGGPTRASLVSDRPEGLLLVVSGGDTGWTSLVTQQGQELWRKPLQPCGPSVPVTLSSASVGEDRLWVSAAVQTGARIPSALLAEVGFDGQVLAVRRFNLEGEHPYLYYSRYRNGRLFAVYATGYAETTRYGIARFQ